MAANAATDYGLDIGGVSDADELFSEVSGLALVRQDAIHRLTTDDVLGPGGQGWGYDCRRMLGMPLGQVAAMPPFLAAVLQRDERIQSATVAITPTTTRGLSDLAISASCTTAAGPFDLVIPSVAAIGDAAFLAALGERSP